MRRARIKLGFDYSDTPERKVVSLEADGIACVPAIGFDNFQRAWKVPEVHYHPECLEISLCLRGSFGFEFRGQTRTLLPGNVAVSGPDDPHRFSSYPKRLSKYWFLFRIPAGRFPLLRLPSREKRWLVQELTALPGRMFNGERLELCFRRIFRIYDSVPAKSPERSLLLRNAVTDLLVRIVECSKSPPRQESNARLKSILREMEEHPERDYRIAELAARAGVSPSNLMKRFKKLTGLPPHAFCVTQRIAKATEMLRQGGRSITSIADELGFASSQHFATSFKQATGVVPKRWKAASTSHAKERNRK
jgi:AraC-like DNA-binding protein